MYVLEMLCVHRHKTSVEALARDGVKFVATPESRVHIDG
jgi:hypothetical protein